MFKPKDQRSPTRINMILLPESQNTKTGNILQSYSSPSSCPVLSPAPSRKAGAMRRISIPLMRLMQDYMLVNISCETVDEVITEKEYGLNVVLTSIYPEADIAALKAKGIPAVQCPAQTKGITCKECRLCSRDRESVVLFEVHGQRKGKARRVIQIKRA